MPGTGWPEPGGFLPREALALASKVAAEGICGMELVEVSPPYDTSDITALLGVRVIVDVLGSMVAHGKLGAHKGHIDKPVSIPAGEFTGRRWRRWRMTGTTTTSPPPPPRAGPQPSAIPIRWRATCTAPTPRPSCRS